MKFISKDNLTYLFDHKAKPVAKVKPGEEFQVETEDAFNSMIKKDSDGTPETLAKIVDKSCPITGPIEIEGAEPGDMIAINIKDITPIEYGVSVLGEHFGPFGHLWPEAVTRVVKISDGVAHFSDKIKIELNPMIGTIGVAPGEEVVYAWRQGSFGGNMDCKEVCAGAVLQLPVFVPGAKLYMGDVHAIQGDGEMCNPFEAPSIIKLSVDVIKGKAPNNPRIISDKKLVTMVSGLNFSECAHAAFIEMAEWLRDDYGFSFNDACFLMGQIADVRACQVANTFHTVRCELPKSYVI